MVAKSPKESFVRVLTCVCVCSCSVVSQCWVIDGLATQIETGFWGGRLQGHHRARTEHALKSTGRELACCDRTEPGTLVMQLFMLPSCSLSLTCASSSAPIFHSCAAVDVTFPESLIIVCRFGHVWTLQYHLFYCTFRTSPDLLDLIATTSLKNNQRHMQMCTCTEGERERERTRKRERERQTLTSSI